MAMKAALATIKAVSDMKDLDSRDLAGMADCHRYPPIDSPGAKFLTDVRDSFLAAYAKHSDFTLLVDDFRRISLNMGNFSENQNQEKWQTFVELGAWEEDLGGWQEDIDMNAIAAKALSSIAERLCYALYDELREEIRRLSS